jgi:hypothetical protein
MADDQEETMSILTSVDLQGWFRERLEAVLDRRGVAVSEPARGYLVTLLTRNAGTAPDLDRPLAFALVEASEPSDLAERFRRHRDLGDRALYLSGFFSEHLERRGLARDYVQAMGARGYGTASGLCRRWGGPAEVLEELAQRFAPMASVLDEVRESTALRTPQDIVRLYDRWKQTRSARLAERLAEEGVFPVELDGETLH